MTWTDQSTPGVIKCGQCDYIFPAWDGQGRLFEAKEGTGTTSDEAIIAHHRVFHGKFYESRWKQEIAPTGVGYPGWEPKP